MAAASQDGTHLGSTRVRVIDADITTLAVDAIVCSANTSLALGGSRSVAGAIVRATGGQVLDELAGVARPIALAAVAVTSGAGLPCRHVLHVATHGSSAEEHAALEAWGIADLQTLRLELVGRCVEAAVEEAARLGCSSLAIPQLAAGLLALPAELVAETLVNRLGNCLLRLEAPPAEVVLVVFQDPVARQRLEALLRTAGRVAEATADAAAADVRAMARQLSNLTELLRARDEELAALRERLTAATGRAPEAGRLPLPVAFAASIVESSSTPAQTRDNLYKALPVLLRYLAALCLAEYHAAGYFDAGVNAFLREVFSRPVTDGTWRQVAHEVALAFLGGPPTWCPELVGLWHRDEKRWGPLNGTLDKLIAKRNEIHDLGMSDESTTSHWLGKTLPLWQLALSQARPVLDLELVYVETLKDFADDGGMRAVYGVRWLMGELFVPRAEIVTWRAGLRRNRLFLTDSARERFLPLSPYLEYEHCDVTGAREVCSLDRCEADKVVLTTFRFRHFVEQGEKPGFL